MSYVRRWDGDKWDFQNDFVHSRSIARAALTTEQGFKKKRRAMIEAAAWRLKIKQRESNIDRSGDGAPGSAIVTGERPDE